MGGQTQVFMERAVVALGGAPMRANHLSTMPQTCWPEHSRPFVHRQLCQIPQQIPLRLHVAKMYGQYDRDMKDEPRRILRASRISDMMNCLVVQPKRQQGRGIIFPGEYGE